MTELKLSTAADEVTVPPVKLPKDVREDGTANVVEVPRVELPQADGNTGAKPAEVLKTDEKPVVTV